MQYFKSVINCILMAKKTSNLEQFRLKSILRNVNGNKVNSNGTCDAVTTNIDTIPIKLKPTNDMQKDSLHKR